eukprot:3372311-Pyramimonas_sp.AAC.1
MIDGGAPPRAFPLVKQEGKRKAQGKAKSASVVDLTTVAAPPSVQALAEWQLDAPFDPVEDAAARWFTAAEKSTWCRFSRSLSSTDD